jgi:hypothetical protein
MKRLAFLFLALSWAGAALGHDASDRGPRGCVAGPPEPRDPLFSALPPQGTAICRYRATDFHARIERLLAVRPGQLGSKEVEQIFSLPRLTLRHHDARSTNLSVILRSATGSEWWSTVIYLQEGFFGPKFKGPPIPLRGLRRPVPVDPTNPGDIMIHIVQLNWLDRPGPPVAPCLTVAALLDSARRHGWTTSSWTRPVPHSAPPGWRHMDMIRGGLSFSTGFSDEKDCVSDFTLAQPANPRPGP